MVGQDVRCSDTNHALPDICDTLAGRYPKDFVFTGWHPFCRCYVVPVLKTEEEVDADMQRILRGEDPLPPSQSENAVEDVPDNFTDWVRENEERIEQASRLPYFIRDNMRFVQVDLGVGIGAHKRGKGAIMRGRDDDQYLQELQADKIANAPISLTPNLLANAEEACEKLKIKRIDMTFEMADGRTPNLNKLRDNCQTAVVVYEARRRGIDVISLGHSEEKDSPSYRLGEDGAIAFKGKDGLPPKFMSLGGNKARIKSKIESITTNEGRYHLGMESGEDGHIIVAEKIKGHDVVFYDPQSGKAWSLGHILESYDKFSILKVSNLELDTDFLLEICEVR